MRLPAALQFCNGARKPPFPALCLAILALLAVGLGGCGTMAKPGPTPQAPRGGGYYLDDGPGANAPPDIDRIPDATPKVEPLRPASMRPYVVNGKEYTPMTSLQPYRARGIASWYGRRYHGKPTSSGETYDMYAMTAAHPVLPIPSYARVTSVLNGRSVVVRINYRGPFLDNREIDLSYALDNGWEGEVVVRMAIAADGSVAALDVSSSSGHAALDRQALEMFRRARAEVLVPDALRGRQFSLELRAVYNLKDQASG